MSATLILWVGAIGIRGSSLRVLHERELPVWLERPPDAFQHCLRVAKLVVHVDEQREIDCPLRQTGIRLGPLHDLDVRDVRTAGFRPDDLEHFRLKIGGNHLP